MNIYQIAKDRGYSINANGDVFSPSMKLNLMKNAGTVHAIISKFKRGSCA